jgi:hypothetical protein
MRFPVEVVDIIRIIETDDVMIELYKGIWKSLCKLLNFQAQFMFLILMGQFLFEECTLCENIDEDVTYGFKVIFDCDCYVY